MNIFFWTILRSRVLLAINTTSVMEYHFRIYKIRCPMITRGQSFFFCKSAELSAKIGLSKWMSKIIRIFLFFSMKNKSLGAHLLKWFFGNFNFKTPLLLKFCPIFDEAQLQGKKIKYFVFWLSNFVYPKMILHNRSHVI